MPYKNSHTSGKNGTNGHHNGTGVGTKEQSGEKPKDPVYELQHVQRTEFKDWYQVPLPIPNLTFDFEWKFPSKFNFQTPDEEAIKGTAGKSNAEECVSAMADATFDVKNPYSQEDYSAQESQLTGRLASIDKMAEDSEKNQRLNDRTEEVETKQPKIENAHFPRFRYMSLIALLACGIGMIIWTIFVLVSASGKMAILYKYPAAAAVFALLPLGVMFLLAECYTWLENKNTRTLYLAGLLVLTLTAFIAWLLTLGPAYGESSIDPNDITSELPFDWYALHITIQLAGEVLIGGLLKISLHIIDRKWRKTVSLESTAGQRIRGDKAMVEAQRAPIALELSALRKSRSARDAAKLQNRETYLAVLHNVRLEHRAQEEAAEAAAIVARANHKLKTVK